MKALVYHKDLELKDIAVPLPSSEEAQIKVTKAGICSTDHEITKGYVKGYNGVLGHEFIGVVEQCSDSKWNGKRVTAEINFACGNCEFCHKQMPRHCIHRTVFGIINQNGAFSEYTLAPQKNLIEIPETIPDTSAIFLEPLAAALEILEQTQVSSEHKVLLIGDGKLAQLIARVLHSSGCSLLVVGKYKDKLGLLENIGIETLELNNYQPAPYNMVVEASGNATGFDLALKSVKPRGTMVVKSIYAGGIQWDPSYLVVNEITMIGSRCGQFSHAIDFLERHEPDLTPLIEKEYEFENALEAFEYSMKKGVKKVLLNF